MWVMPIRTASRNTDTASLRSAGGPNTCGPASCIAPYPILVTTRSSDMAYVPPGRVRADGRTSLLLVCDMGFLFCIMFPDDSFLQTNGIRSSCARRQNVKRERLFGSDTKFLFVRSTLVLGRLLDLV